MQSRRLLLGNYSDEALIRAQIRGTGHCAASVLSSSALRTSAAALRSRGPEQKTLRYELASTCRTNAQNPARWPDTRLSTSADSGAAGSNLPNQYNRHKAISRKYLHGRDQGGRGGKIVSGRMGLILGPGITNDPRQFRRLIAHLAQKGDGEPCESFIVMCDTLHEKEVVSSTLNLDQGGTIRSWKKRELSVDSRVSFADTLLWEFL